LNASLLGEFPSFLYRLFYTSMFICLISSFAFPPLFTSFYSLFLVHFGSHGSSLLQSHVKKKKKKEKKKSPSFNCFFTFNAHCALWPPNFLLIIFILSLSLPLSFFYFILVHLFVVYSMYKTEKKKKKPKFSCVVLHPSFFIPESCGVLGFA
jgi:hypothetical protein